MTQEISSLRHSCAPLQGLREFGLVRPRRSGWCRPSVMTATERPSGHDLLIMCPRPDLLPSFAYVVPLADESFLEHRIPVLAF